jgi:hypothetical protein
VSLAEGAELCSAAGANMVSAQAAAAVNEANEIKEAAEPQEASGSA